MKLRLLYAVILFFQVSAWGNYQLSPTPIPQEELAWLKQQGVTSAPSVTVDTFRTDATELLQILYDQGLRRIGNIHLRDLIFKIKKVPVEIVDGLALPNDSKNCTSSRDSAQWGFDPHGVPFIRVNDLLWNRPVFDVRITLALHEGLSATKTEDGFYDCSILLWLLAHKADLVRAHFTEAEITTIRDEWTKELCPGPGRPPIAIPSFTITIDEGSERVCQNPTTLAGGSIGVGGGGEERGVAWKQSQVDAVLSNVFQARTTGSSVDALGQLLYILKGDFEVLRPGD